MRLSRWLVAFLALAVVSCGGGGPVLHPVSGTVLFDGQPADGATVVFHPSAGGPDAPRPSGTVGKDGAFALRTYPHGDAAPAGEYVVLVTWLEAVGTDGDTTRNRLPARYADPAQSGLKAIVQPGVNRLEPFVLTKKGK